MTNWRRSLASTPECLHDLSDRCVAWRRLTVASSFIGGEAVQRRERRSRFRQREPLNERHGFGRGAARASVDPWMRIEGGDTTTSVELVPSLQCAQPNSGCLGDGGEGYLIFNV